MLDIETLQGDREKFPEMPMVLPPSLPVFSNMRRNGLGELVRKEWEIPNSRFDVTAMQRFDGGYIKPTYGGGISLSHIQQQIINMYKIPQKRRNGFGELVESGISVQFKLQKNRRGLKQFEKDIDNTITQILQRSVRIGKSMRRNGLGELVPKIFPVELTPWA